VLPSTHGAHGEVATERNGAAARDRRRSAEVSARQGGAVPREVVLAVPDDDVGEPEHRGAWLEVNHQAIEDVRPGAADGAAGSSGLRRAENDRAEGVRCGDLAAGFFYGLVGCTGAHRWAPSPWCLSVSRSATFRQLSLIGVSADTKWPTRLASFWGSTPFGSQVRYRSHAE